MSVAKLAEKCYLTWIPWRNFKPLVVPSVLTPDEIEYINEFPKAKWATVIRDKKFVPYAFSCRNHRIIWMTQTSVDIANLEHFFRTMAWMTDLYGHTGHVRLFYWDSPDIRHFPLKGPIESIHVNGGAAHVCNMMFINVFRREEAEKVLIHELVHGLCADVDTESIDAAIQSTLGTTTDLRLPEAYTEFMAEWYYIVSRWGYSQEAFLQAWNTQIRYANNLVCKILNYYRRKHILDTKHPWNESTAVFSYYVMKTVLLHHANEVLHEYGAVHKWPEWLSEYNTAVHATCKQTRKRGRRHSMKMLSKWI